MRLTIVILTLLASLGLSSVGSAFTAILPRDSRFTGGLLLEEIDYSPDNDTSPKTENKLLFGGYKHAFSPQFSLGGGLGFLFDGDIGDGSKIGGGSGYRIFLDGDFLIMQSGANRVIGSFGLNLDRFKFHENGVTTKLEMTDLLIGGLVSHQFGKIALHGGLDIYLMSDGKLKTSVRGASSTTDVERDSRLNLRLGAAFAATPAVDLRLDLLLFGQQTILLGCDFRI